MDLTPQQRNQFDAIFNAPTPANLRRLAPNEFTQFIVYLFRREGIYDPINMDGTGDGGIDIQLRAFVGSPPMLLGVAQCKRYLYDRIQLKHIREFRDTIRSANVQSGFFFTTGYVTSGAKKLSLEVPNIYLLDANEIAKWIARIRRKHQPPGYTAVGDLPVPVFCVANHKGGVGKTAITCSLAAGLARENMNVLVIDTDPQCNLSRWLLPKNTSNFRSVASLQAVYQEQHPIQPLIITTTTIPRVFVLPSHRDLQPNLNYDQERFLAEGLAKLPLNDPRIDAIIIDTRPTLDGLTKSAVIASRYLIVPFRPDEPSDMGVEQFFDFIEGVESSQQLMPLDVLGGVAIAVDTTNFTREKMLEIRDNALNHPRIKRTQLDEYSFWLGTMRNRLNYRRAEREHRSVFAIDARSDASTDITKLAREVLNRVSVYAYPHR